MTKKAARDAAAVPPPITERVETFVLTDAIRLRTTALDLTMRAVSACPAFAIKTAADLTKEAELLEVWLKGAK